MINFTLSSAILLELCICIIGLFSILRKKISSTSESYCYSVILILALYSVSIQISFLVKLQALYYLFDVCITAFFVIQIWLNRQTLSETISDVVEFLKRSNKVVCFCLILVLNYLFFQVLLLPPSNWDSMTYHLARVLMALQEGSIFLKNFTHYPQVTYPWGYDILSFLFLRFYSDFGLAIFSFLSYTVIIVGTYSLVNKVFQNPDLSLTVSFVIASLKGVVLQATTTKNDIPAAAIVVVCFLAAYGVYRYLRGVYLYIIIVSLLFGLTVKNYFLNFALPFLFFFSLFLLKQHSFKSLFTGCKLKQYLGIHLVLPLGLFLCLTLFWVDNFDTYGHVLGDSSFTQGHLNQNGGLGGLANAVRFVLRAVDIPVELCGNVLTKVHNNILGEYQTIATRNPNIWPPILEGNLKAEEDSSWYGPLGMLLVIPAILCSLLMGKGFVRIVSLSLLAFCCISLYEVVWMPWNGRFFSLFFAGSGVCIAFVLTRFLQEKWLRFLIALLALFTLLHAVLFNVNKPFLHQRKFSLFLQKLTILDTDYLAEQFRHPGTLFLPWLKHVAKRNFYAENHYRNKGLIRMYADTLKPGKRVLIVGRTDSWVFPFLLAGPNVDITVSGPERIFVEGRVYNINNRDDYRRIKDLFDYLLILEVEVGQHIKKEPTIFYVSQTPVYLTPIYFFKLQ